MPISLYPGIASALSNYFGKNDDYLSFSKNVQNITLLASPISPFNIPENNNFIIDKSALDSEGSSAEAVSHKPTSDQISIYVVREGDTLSQIAEMFNVTVNTIKWNNDIRSNTLRPGDTLVILPITGVRHTVKKGDTLASIAKLYKGDKDEIIAYNEITGTLVVGSVIIIPDGEITPTVSGSSTSGTRVSGLKEYVGYYLRPVAGGRKTQGLHGYNAVDLGAPIGTPIMASAPGEVIISRNGGWNGGYGIYVVIRHSNGTQTLYAHNNSNTVSAGDTVKQGDIIGYVGRTGKATGSHVHFEIRGGRNPF